MPQMVAVEQIVGFLVPMVARAVGEARSLGIAQYSAVTERELAEGSDGVGSSWPRASGDSAAAAADVKFAGKARPPGIAKRSATTVPELAQSPDESWAFLVQSKWQRRRDSSREVCWRSSASRHREAECGGAGPSWSRAYGSAAATAAVKSTGIVKYGVTSESESELADDLELARVALQRRRGMW